MATLLSVFWFLIKLFFWIVLLAAFLHSFLTHFIVWLEIRYKQLHNPLFNVPKAILLRNFIIEMGCIFAHFITLPFANLIGNSKPYSSQHSSLAKTPPILLIHGFLHTRNDWLWFQHQLQSLTDIGPIFTINLPSPKSIAEDALALDKTLQHIHKTTQMNEIILIGHSRGGLVASYYTEHFAPKGKVSAVINIGSPFSGTKLAAFNVENAKEMAPNSAFLAKLKEHIQHSTTPYYHIASKLDNLVVPWHSACPWQLRTPENSLILEDYGHLRLLISPRVVSQVVEWIFKENKLN